MGEKQRTVAALVVCLLAIFVYFNVVLPMISPRPEPAPQDHPRPGPAPAEKRRAHPTPPGAPSTTPAKTISRPSKALPKVEPLPEQKPTEYVRETKLLRVVLTNRGAAIKHVTLRDFYTFPQEDPQRFGGDLRLITAIVNSKLSLAMAAVNGPGNLDTKIWQFVPDAPVPTGFVDVAQFKTRVPELGLEITKTFKFRQPDPGTDGALTAGRDIELEVGVENVGETEVEFKYTLRSAAGIMPEPEGPPRYPGQLERERGELQRQKSRYVQAVVGGLSGDKAKLETFSPGDAPQRYPGAGARPIYAGMTNRYFAAVLQPLASNSEITAVLIEKVGEHNVASNLEITSEHIPPGGVSTKSYMFLVVPRMAEVFDQYPGRYFGALLEPGWLGPIKKVLTWLLRAFHRVIPNYGWAIVLLTVCVRLVLHPLTLKSQKSTHKMQKIQPLISEVKQKYKHDKRQQQQEVMKVMREQGANPLGGCLPMLLQLPIFIALFQTLRLDVGLRHAPFMLWINDLSKPDNLIAFGSALPITGWRSLNLLPLLSAGLMILQQKMMPQSPDPQAQQQQKIMMIMPAIFAVMLYGMPSGLMVYFISSSAFGMGEQYLIRRRLDAAAAVASAQQKPTVPVEQKRQNRAPQRRKKRPR